MSATPEVESPPPFFRFEITVSRLLAKRAVSAEGQSEPTVNSQLNLNQELPDIFLPKTSKCCLTRLSRSDPLHLSTFIIGTLHFVKWILLRPIQIVLIFLSFPCCGI